MTVIGWAKHVAELPTGIDQLRNGTWSILLGKGQYASTPHDRLKLQVDCFDAGIDFLPSSPAQELTCQDAITLANAPDLQARFLAVIGAGQFTLTLRPQIPLPSAVENGRAWLLARKAAQDQEALLQAMFAQMVQRTGLRSTKLRRTPTTLQCDLLVKRQAAVRTYEKLAHWGTVLNAPSGTKLIVTGLWPPFGFFGASHDSAVAA